MSFEVKELELRFNVEIEKIKYEKEIQMKKLENDLQLRMKQYEIEMQHLRYKHEIEMTKLQERLKEKDNEKMKIEYEIERIKNEAINLENDLKLKLEDMSQQKERYGRENEKQKIILKNEHEIRIKSLEYNFKEKMEQIKRK